MAKTMINLCVYRLPPSPYIKEWRRRGPALSMARPKGSPTPTGIRIPPFPSWSKRGRKEERGRRKGGRRPPSLVQFELEGEGRVAPPWPALSPSTKAHVAH